MSSAVHISLNVSNLPRSTDFYRRFFGEPMKLKSYALQEKFWVTDPDGNRWEVYTVLEDIEQKAEVGTTCCTPKAETGKAAAACC